VARVAVIGGGLLGASTAYRLRQHGADVTVIDCGAPGQATAAGAGLLPPLDHFSGLDALLPLLKSARAHYPELLQALAADGQGDTGYAVVGALHVATDERELARLPAIADASEARRAAGFTHIGQVSSLGAAETRALFPALSPGVLGAVHCAEAARVDGRRLLAALRAAVLQRGGRWLRSRATLELQGERVTGVRIQGELLEADAVVIAAGAWSALVSEQLGLKLALGPQRGQLIHLDLPGTRTDNWPMVVGFGSNYLLSFPEGRIVAGATREMDVGHAALLTAGGVREVLDSALRLAPGLAHATLSEMRVGLRPVTADGKPILGAVAAYPNLYFATGHGGYGLEVGPYSGAIVADLVLGRTVPIDLTPFAAERFERQAPPPL
jgi:glycine/D-amino acid oxidase-like deaminating enzyme